MEVKVEDAHLYAQGHLAGAVQISWKSRPKPKAKLAGETIRARRAANIYWGRNYPQEA